MSEINKSEITIVLSDLIEFMVRNNINSIIRNTNGITFVKKQPTNKPKTEHPIKECLEKALLYISDENAQDRCARALIKHALEQL
ncbi:hypothetical protein GQ473_00205 [archaeon]|nr:hypothetical protein [archaeon]